MKDAIIKGTGNSRYIRSGISPTTTWEQFRQMLISGTAPIDLNGVNPAGFQQMGSALNKGNILPDELCDLLGIPRAESEPKDAFLGAIQQAKKAMPSTFQKLMTGRLI